jgi:gas vesicle protein
MKSITSIIKRRFDAGYSLEDLLNSELEDKSREEKLQELVESDSTQTKGDVAFGGLMVGDFLYDYLRLDPSVIKAADFSRQQDIADLFEFSSFSKNINAGSSASFDGNIHNLKGYVGEQLVAQQLQSQGYEVEFPSTSNNEAYDLLVNGEKFQVKISADGQSIREHLTEHPDIPVFTNGDIPESLAGDPNVFPIHSITEQGLEETTRASLDAGIEIFDIEIPGLLATVAVGKNAFRLITGNTDAKNGVLNVAEETIGRGSGAFVGSKMVGVLGASIGPYGAIVGSMIGAVVGGSAANRIVQAYKEQWRLADESQDVRNRLDDFLQAAHGSACKAEQIFDRKTTELLANLKGLGEDFRPLYHFTARKVEKERSYLNDQIQKLKEARNNPNALVPSYVDTPNLLYISGQAVLTAMKAKVHPYSVDQQLRELTKSVDIFRQKYAKL